MSSVKQMYDDLLMAKNLLDKGILTQEEYEGQKRIIMARRSDASRATRASSGRRAQPAVVTPKRPKTASPATAPSSAASASTNGTSRTRLSGMAKWVSMGFTVTKTCTDGTSVTISDPRQVPPTPPKPDDYEPGKEVTCPDCPRMFKTVAAMKSHRRATHPAAASSSAKQSEQLVEWAPKRDGPAPAPQHVRRRKQVYRYSYPSMYPALWPHLRFKTSMSRIRHNYTRRVDSRPHGFDARKFNRGSQGKRHRHTYEEMAAVLHKREMFIADGLTPVRGSLTYTDRQVHLNSGTTSRWHRRADHIFSMAADEWCKKLKVSVSLAKRKAGHYRHFPTADEALYQLFCKRRKAGRPVSIRWLLLKYKFYVNKFYPDKPCKANKTVVKRWRKKYKVVQRRKTNKKRESREDRLAACRLYHWQNISKRSSGEQVDGVYGRIKPVNTFSLDQSPVPFALQSGVTYEQRGVTEVWVNQPAAGRWTLFNSSMIPSILRYRPFETFVQR